MNLYGAQNLGLIQRLDKRCQTGVANYPIKNKVADINDALDWYFRLAFKTARGWEFDDSNETLPPIDTQNIVSGTNRYKVSSFTEKIINLIKLEILDSDGNGHDLIPETFDTLGTPVLGNASGVIGGSGGSNFQDLYLDPSSGLPTHYCKFGDFIYLRPSPNYSETSGLKAYFNRPASKFEFVTFTVTQASPGVFTSTAHGLALNDTILLETDGTLLTGLSADTVYWIISGGLTADAFEVSTSKGGSAVNTTSTQSGTHYFLKLNGEPGIPEIHHRFLVDYATHIFLNDMVQSKLGMLPRDIQIAEQEIKEFYSLRGKDIKPSLTAFGEDNR